MSVHKETRFGIIGAGPAGLAAAYYLREKGFKHITILEKEAVVGGKCHTYEYEGRPFELGAFTVTWAYKNTRAIAKAKKIKLVQQPPRLVFNGRSGYIASIKQALLADFSMWSLGSAIVRYFVALWRYRRVLRTPGFRNVTQHRELTESFATWATREKLYPLLELFRLPVKDMGYGELRDIPAVYILKYIGFWNFLTLVLYGMGWLKRWPKRFERGFQSLWTAVAEDFDVRLGVEVQHVDRSQDVIRVQCQNQPEMLFDKLILACPLDKALAFLPDATPAETRLFSDISYQDYYVTLATAEGVPNEIIDALDDLEDGHIWEMMRAWDDTDLCSFYTLGNEQIQGEEILRRIRAEVPQLYPDGNVLNLHTQKQWAYFPHVDGKTMRQGYYAQLEDLQGTKNTYYTGGLLAFEVVENVVSYSKALVGRFFTPT